MCGSQRQGPADRAKLIGYCILVFLFLILPASAQARSGRAEERNPPSEAVVAAARQGPTDPKELEAFLDPLFAQAMAEAHVPGAVFLVVKDGQVFFSKGYGYADLATGSPISPDQTIFSVYSLSKLFTATAIMQLVEQGQIALDADANTYLKRFHIPNPYPRPITIHDLLTHTAGFDDDLGEIGGSARTEKEALSLAPYLAHRAPAPLWPPGERYLYTNVAYDLLGLVVEDVSGQPFADYVAAHILQPLGMTRSSFRQRLVRPADVAVTYHYADGQQAVLPAGVLQNGPAAGLTTTASDMTRFMIAHLQDGRYASTRILQASTAQQMHQQHFTYDPAQPGMTYGFREAGSPRTWNGLRELSSAWGPVLWHDGGGARAPTSYLQLLPEQGLGLFIAFNSDEYSFLDQVLSAFYDHYDPVRPPSPLPTPPGADGNGRGPDLDRFTGIYRPTGYARRTLAKLLLLQGDDLPQVIASGTTLAIRWLPADAAPPQPLVQKGPRVFTGADDQFQFTFLAGPGDQITGMEWGNLFVLEKVPWYETLGFQRGLIAGFLLVFLVGAGAWPVARLRNRLRPRPAADPRAPVLVWLLLAGTGLLNAVFLLGLIWLLPRALDLGLQFGMPPGLGALFVLPLTTSGLAVGLLVLTLPVWRSRAWSVLGRSAYSGFTLVALAFIPFLLYWNLLGFQW